MTAPSMATITPPTSSHSKEVSGKGDWKYSVPIYGDNRTEALQNRPDHGVPSQNTLSNRPALSNTSVKSGSKTATHANGYYLSKENSEYDFHASGHLPDENRHYTEYLTAPSAPLLSKRGSVVSSNHDGDSVLDLYGGRLSVIGGANGDFSGRGSSLEESAITANGSGKTSYVIPGVGPESSKWIHRDKLAQIEGNEAADYLYDVGKSRWIHKDKLERIEIEELQQAGAPIPSAQTGKSSIRNENVQKEKKKHGSSVSSDEEQGVDGEFHDIRTAEEIATDDTPIQTISRKQFKRNASYSRIPLASLSPHPIPQQFIERTTPLPRTPITPNGSDDGGPPALRKRSYSAGSAFLLDENSNSGIPITPAPGTNIVNPKNRGFMSPSQRRSATSRNGSIGAKQRTRSNPQLSSNRPGTSASHATHGSGGTQGSSNKSPEGPPPWAVASYKPDPSLPPDQQIIPTLARRMQQDQWERDGLYASVYDREMRPLKVHDGEDIEKTNHNDNGTKKKEEWPLKSSSPLEPPAREQRTEPRSPTDGGYSLMPNVAGSAPFESPPQFPQLRPSDDDKDRKKKYCCCVIM